MSVVNYLTKIHYAPGVLADAAPTELAALAAKRPLIVTDKGVAAAGLLERLVAALPPGAAHAVFDDTPQNPTEPAARAAAAAHRAHEADVMIALGGGSPMDLAKAAALVLAHDGPLLPLAAIEGGAAKIKPLPPVLAIPTTAGTGSEVGRGAIVIVEDGRKLGFISPHLIPRAAICDAELTLGLPPILTAATGMDALTHAVETYCARADNPAADGIALEGLRRCARALERATRDGSDRAARHDMMGAAFCGALAFQKGLGSVHAASHALGGLARDAHGAANLHHGMLNAALLPHALRVNAEIVGERYGDIAVALGLDRDADLPGALTALTARLGLPTRLSEMGVDDATLAAAAPLAKADHTDATTPRPMSEADYLSLMRAAL